MIWSSPTAGGVRRAARSLVSRTGSGVGRGLRGSVVFGSVPNSAAPLAVDREPGLITGTAFARSSGHWITAGLPRVGRRRRCFDQLFRPASPPFAWAGRPDPPLVWIALAEQPEAQFLHRAHELCSAWRAPPELVRPLRRSDWLAVHAQASVGGGESRSPGAGVTSIARSPCRSVAATVAGRQLLACRLCTPSKARTGQ